jgi:hypothetical protein
VILIETDNFNFIVFKNGNIVVKDGDVAVGVVLVVSVEGNFICWNSLVVEWRFGWGLVAAASAFTTGELFFDGSGGGNNRRV